MLREGDVLNVPGVSTRELSDFCRSSTNTKNDLNGGMCVFTVVGEVLMKEEGGKHHWRNVHALLCGLRGGSIEETFSTQVRVSRV
jgi:hypothetical protein